MNAYICGFFIYTFEEKIPQKGAYPLQTQISNDCIYTCWVNINQLLGDAVLVILLVISDLDLYNDSMIYSKLNFQINSGYLMFNISYLGK